MEVKIQGCCSKKYRMNLKQQKYYKNLFIVYNIDTKISELNGLIYELSIIIMIISTREY